MVICNVQDMYRCDQCKSASDEYGRMCKHGALFPLLLAMSDQKNCPNYKLDTDKVKLKLQEGEKHETER